MSASNDPASARGPAPAEVSEPAGPTVDDLLAEGVAPSPAAVAPGCVVGEVVADDHPTLVGRVRVRFPDGDGKREAWVPTLQGLAVRPRDRVLVMQPAGLPEPVVTGVLDGFTRREPQTRVGAQLALKNDETLRVCDQAGNALIEIQATPTGPVVRLLSDDSDVELPGRLRLRAKSLELEALAGPIKIKASDDVVVEGEIINLN